VDDVDNISISGETRNACVCNSLRFLIDWAKVKGKLLVSRVLAIFVGIILAAAYSLAGSNTGYSFLRGDAGARSAALAGSFVSVTGDPNSIFYNPAALSTLTQSTGSISFQKHLIDINSGALSYAQELDEIGHVSAGLMYYNYGSFDETDNSGNALGTFSANDIALSVGYSNLFEENLHWGVATKLIYSQIVGYSSTALAVDAGILYAIPESRVMLGASVRNLGGQLNSFVDTSDTKENLPLDITIGGSIVPKGLPLLLNVSFSNLNEQTDNFGERFSNFAIGGEFTLSPVVQARVGYDNQRRKDLKIGTSAGLAGFSGGIGITIDEYKVDYALSSLGKVGALHHLTLGVTL